MFRAIDLRQYPFLIISSSEILAEKDFPYLRTFMHRCFEQKLANKNITTTLKVLLIVSASVLAVVAVRGLVSPPGTCITLATTSRGNLLTTKAVNEAGPGTIDATGCDIGDYINTNLPVSSLTVHDANQYGIFVDSSLGSITVSIAGTTVYNIGAHTGTSFTPNGVQTGIGIIYDSGASGPQAKGSIDSSTVKAYQKGGIEVNHNSNVTTTNNVVTGLGHVSFIAQNGIEYARDASGIIRGNTVSGNFYTGGTGILADGSSCGGSNPACPPGRQFVSCGILLVLIDPNNIQRGQNDVNAPPPNDNQRNYAVVTDAVTD